jgi:type I restriction enzyme, R subunit
MKPEEKARKEIDHWLQAAGWLVQDVPDLNLSAAVGIAIREFPLSYGTADYLIYDELFQPGHLLAQRRQPGGLR